MSAENQKDRAENVDQSDGHNADAGEGGAHVAKHAPPRFVVGLGASAGGLEALERVFRTMPADTGMAFVIIQHLSPNFDSMMDELLRRQTKMQVHMVEDRVEVAANSVYLIPSGKEMIVSNGRLLLTDKDPQNGLSLPIDQFFRSLAREYGERSIGVILSGTGSDGSRGIVEIHDCGGLVISQSEESAKFDGMPRSAVETGVVDIVVPPEDVAPTLLRYSRNPTIGELTSTEDLVPVDENSMNRLLRLLHDSHGIDFSLYKPGTVRRRIERRLLINQSTDFEDYVERVDTDPDERNSLYHDLLIGVTQFFRDKEAFHLLEQKVIPDLIAAHPKGDEFRVWVAGCATGEEAYSLAILIDEVSRRMKRDLDVRIFATDLHKASLDAASAGVYAASAFTDVPQERQEEYFEPHGNGYRVVQSLRQRVVFAQHNIIKDAPFTKLNLISCRNLLIYLQPSIQQKVISLFHFGLRTRGILFLGPSEGVADLEAEFANIDRHWKVFRKHRDSRLPTDLSLPMTPGMPKRAPGHVRNTLESRSESELLNLYNQVLDQCVPTAVLIDDQYNVLHIFGDADRFLRLPKGRPSYSLLALLENELKTACAGAVQRSIKEQRQTAYSGLRLEDGDDTLEIRLLVTPLQSKRSEATHLLIRFEVLESAADSKPDEVKTLDIGEVSRERTEALEIDLRRTRESLQATIEELETSNEELHATNEEIVASNEELQSTNEELHSVNEELYTVNAEYQRKIVELTELHDDMQHLLDSTDVGTVFLDAQLCIRKVTPRIAETCNILERDIGRQFSSFTHNIDHPNFMSDIRQVLSSGDRVEREVRDRRGRWYYLRILPYRPRGSNDGVVITLIDSQPLHDAREQLQEQELLLQAILDNAPAFIFVRDEGGRYLLANQEARKWFHINSQEVLGRTDHELLPRPLADRLQVAEREVITAGESRETELMIDGPDGSETWLVVMFPIRSNAGRITRVAGIATNISARKLAETQVQQSLSQRDRFLAMLSHELRNPLGAILTGLKLLGRPGVKEGQRIETYRMLEQQSMQMSILLDDLLDVARIENDRLKIRLESVRLSEVTQHAEAAVRDRFQEANVSLTLNLLDTEIFVQGDPARLQQIVLNLLVNAAKYTPSGGRVELELSRREERAVIAVTDNGAGISAELQPHIFDLFVQADNTLPRTDGGMGVGLSLTKALVEMHNGEIDVKSDGIGLGSRFEVRLPIATAVADLVAPRIEPPVEGQLPSLFLVDDNDQLRDTLASMLRDDGYMVGTESTGTDAVDRLLEQPFEVAIVDLGLPEMDGFEVARALRKTFTSQQMRLIAVTGYGRPEDRARALAAGFDLHLTKPVAPERLKEAIHSLHKQQTEGGPPNDS